MKRQQGFTLIELMIVVAIIGILAAIAIPSYQDFTARGKVSEGVVLASAPKASINEFVLSLGRWPLAGGSIGHTSPNTQYVRSVAIANSQITITFGASAGVPGGSTIIMGAATSGGGVVWHCKGGNLSNKFRPSNCRT